MANVNIKPLGDRVLVHPIEEKELKKAASSFLIPQRKSLRKAKSSLSEPGSAMMTERSSNSP
jgi:co-chaperonin GroES (HSP10)